MYKQSIYPGVHTSPQRSEIVMMEEEETRCARKNNFVERKQLIRCYQRNGCMDLSELQPILYTVKVIIQYFSNGRFRLKTMVCQAWAQERALLNSHWLVLKNGLTDFHDYWFVNSIQQERTYVLQVCNNYCKCQHLWQVSQSVSKFLSSFL